MILFNLTLTILYFFIAGRFVRKASWGNKRGLWYKMCLAKAMVFICGGFYWLSECFEVSPLCKITILMLNIIASVVAAYRLTITRRTSIKLIEKEFVKKLNENNL